MKPSYARSHKIASTSSVSHQQPPALKIVPVVRNVYRIPPVAKDEGSAATGGEIDILTEWKKRNSFQIHSYQGPAEVSSASSPRCQPPPLMIPPPLISMQQSGAALPAQTLALIQQLCPPLPQQQKEEEYEKNKRSTPSYNGEVMDAVTAQLLPLLLSGFNVCYSCRLPTVLTSNLVLPDSMGQDPQEATLSVERAILHCEKRAVLVAMAVGICVHIAHQPVLEKHEGPSALILCPTKQMCEEVHYLVDLIASPFRLVSHCSFDPFPAMPVHRRADIVISTPMHFYASFGVIVPPVQNNLKAKNKPSSWIPSSYYSLTKVSMVAVLNVDCCLEMLQAEEELSDLCQRQRDQPSSSVRPVLMSELPPDTQFFIVYSKCSPSLAEEKESIARLSSLLQLPNSDVDFKRWKHPVLCVTPTSNVKAVEETKYTSPDRKKRRIEPSTEKEEKAREDPESDKDDVPSTTAWVMLFNLAMPVDASTWADVQELIQEISIECEKVEAVLLDIEIGWHSSTKIKEGGSFFHFVYSAAETVQVNKASSEDLQSVINSFPSIQTLLAAQEVFCLLKCASSASAMAAFRQLHGRVFDGRVVCAQYIHDSAIPFITSERERRSNDEPPVLPRLSPKLLRNQQSVIMLRNVCENITELTSRKVSNEEELSILEDMEHECCLFGHLVPMQTATSPDSNSQHQSPSHSSNSVTPFILSAPSSVVLARSNSSAAEKENQGSLLDRMRLFVRYSHSLAAANAIRHLDGRNFAGRKLVVTLFDNDRLQNFLLHHQRASDSIKMGQEHFMCLEHTTNQEGGSDDLGPNPALERSSLFEADPELLDLLFDS